MIGMWIGIVLMLTGFAVLATVMVRAFVRVYAQAERELPDPTSPEQADAARLAARQRQIERDRKPAHRNPESETCEIVRSAVARKRSVNGKRVSRWEPRFWSRPRSWVREG